MRAGLELDLLRVGAERQQPLAVGGERRDHARRRRRPGHLREDAAVDVGGDGDAQAGERAGALAPDAVALLAARRHHAAAVAVPRVGADGLPRRAVPRRRAARERHGALRILRRVARGRRGRLGGVVEEVVLAVVEERARVLRLLLVVGQREVPGRIHVAAHARGEVARREAQVLARGGAVAGVEAHDDAAAEGAVGAGREVGGVEGVVAVRVSRAHGVGGRQRGQRGPRGERGAVRRGDAAHGGGVREDARREEEHAVQHSIEFRQLFINGSNVVGAVRPVAFTKTIPPNAWQSTAL